MPVYYVTTAIYVEDDSIEKMLPKQKIEFCEEIRRTAFVAIKGMDVKLDKERGVNGVEIRDFALHYSTSERACSNTITLAQDEVN